VADKDDKNGVLKLVSEILPKLGFIQKYKPPTPIQERLLSMPAHRTVLGSVDNLLSLCYLK